MVKNNFDFEDIYAMRLLAFEREMARQNRRPPLPTLHTYANTAPAAERIRREQQGTRNKIFKGVLKNISAGEAIDSKTLAARMETTPQKLSNYVKAMSDEGYLTKLNVAGNKNMYMYMKTAKKFKGG